MPWALRLFDELDPVAVRVAHEAQPVAAVADGVWRLLGLDPLLGQVLEGPIEVVRGDRDVAVARPEVVAVDAEVVGQLEARPVAVARLVHEHVDRLVADRDPSDLLEAERLVERDRAVDVGDAVAGVDERHGRSLPRRAWRRSGRIPWGV